MKITRIKVNKEILLWALEYSQKTIKDLKKLPVEKWINDKSTPTFRQLQEFAKLTYTPIGVFFLNEPPKEKIDIPFFRTKSGKVERSLTPNLRETIELATKRQQWMKDCLHTQRYWNLVGE